MLRADSFPTLVLALLPLTALSAWLIGDPRRSAIGVGMGLFATQVIVPLDQGGTDAALYMNNSLALVIGVALVFYNAKSALGWLLALGALVALLAGVLGSLQFSLRSMSAFDLIVILVLAVGGLGLFLASLRNG